MLYSLIKNNNFFSLNICFLLYSVFKVHSRRPFRRETTIRLNNLRCRGFYILQTCSIQHSSPICMKSEYHMYFSDSSVTRALCSLSPDCFVRGETDFVRGGLNTRITLCLNGLRVSRNINPRTLSCAGGLKWTRTTDLTLIRRAL